MTPLAFDALSGVVADKVLAWTTPAMTLSHLPGRNVSSGPVAEVGSGPGSGKWRAQESEARQVPHRLV